MVQLIGRDQFGNVLAQEEDGIIKTYSRTPIGLEFERSKREEGGLVAYYPTERGSLVVIIHRSFSDTCRIPGTYHVHLPIDGRRLNIHGSTLFVIPEEAVENAEI